MVCVERVQELVDQTEQYQTELLTSDSYAINVPRSDIRTCWLWCLKFSWFTAGEDMLLPDNTLQCQRTRHTPRKTWVSSRCNMER